MKKINVKSNFFKDTMFNAITHRKYALVNKALLFFCLTINAFVYVLSLFIGSQFFIDANRNIRLFNMLLFLGLVTIGHRFKVNSINVQRDISDLECNVLLTTSIESVEILPKKFILYEDIPLFIIRKIYKEGAYIIIKTEISEFIFKTVEEDVYLIEDSDVKEIEEVKTLKLSRELI